MANGTPTGEINPEKDSIKTMLAKWALAQGAPTVLLILIGIAGYRGFNYTVDVAVPKHLEQIQHGYERIEHSHDARMRATLERYGEDRKEDRDLIRELKMERNRTATREPSE